jgi:hypothetical protein
MSTQTNDDGSQWLITPDLSEAVEMSDAQIPPGVYKARVVGMEKRVSKTEAATQYIKWELAIFGAEGDLARFNNWKVYTNTMLSGKGTGILKAFYKACTGQELIGQVNFGLLHGSEVQVTLVEGQPYNGQPSKFPEVKKVEAIAAH